MMVFDRETYAGASTSPPVDAFFLVPAWFPVRAHTSANVTILRPSQAAEAGFLARGALLAESHPWLCPFWWVRSVDFPGLCWSLMSPGSLSG